MSSRKRCGLRSDADIPALLYRFKDEGRHHSIALRDVPYVIDYAPGSAVGRCADYRAYPRG